jgi:hypothetical protein
VSAILRTTKVLNTYMGFLSSEYNPLVTSSRAWGVTAKDRPNWKRDTSNRMVDGTAILKAIQRSAFHTPDHKTITQTKMKTPQHWSASNGTKLAFSGGTGLFYVLLTDRMNEIRVGGSKSGSAHVGGNLAAMVNRVQNYMLQDVFHITGPAFSLTVLVSH